MMYLRGITRPAKALGALFLAVARSSLVLSSVALAPFSLANDRPNPPQALQISVHSGSTDAQLENAANEVSSAITAARAQDPNTQINVVIATPESAEAAAPLAAQPQSIDRQRVMVAVARGALSGGASMLTLTLLPDVEWYQTLLTATSLGVFSYNLKLRREAYDRFLDHYGGKTARFLHFLTLRGLRLENSRFASSVRDANQYTGKLFMWFLVENAFLATSEVTQQLMGISHHSVSEAFSSIFFSSLLSTYFQAPTELYLFGRSRLEYANAPEAQRLRVQRRYDLMLLGLSASSIALGVAMQQEVPHMQALALTLGTAGVVLNLHASLLKHWPRIKSEIASRCTRLFTRP